jgi:predicted DNA-binding protein
VSGHYLEKAQFSAIFANFLQKIGVFLETQCKDHIFCKKQALHSLSKKCQHFKKFFVENISKIITSVPATYFSDKVARRVCEKSRQKCSPTQFKKINA